MTHLKKSLFSILLITSQLVYTSENKRSFIEAPTNYKRQRPVASDAVMPAMIAPATFDTIMSPMTLPAAADVTMPAITLPAAVVITSHDSASNPSSLSLGLNPSDIVRLEPTQYQCANDSMIPLRYHQRSELPATLLAMMEQVHVQSQSTGPQNNNKSTSSTKPNSSNNSH